MLEEDLTHYSAPNHDFITKKFRSIRYEGLFTPPDLKGTLMLPGTRGGAEWGGAAYDPATTVLFIRSNDAPDIQTIIKEERQETGDLLVQGQSFYMTYCSSCHGRDKNGIEPSFPSLLGLKNRSTREAVLVKIRKGGGLMHGFTGILKEKEEEGIMAFIYGLEQKANKKVTKVETDKSQPGPDIYLNITGYITWRDPSGNPALRPPWGKLHALNLSTGEFEWQIPLGNDEARQEKGAPETGQEGKPGPIVTAGGLIFISGGEDKKLRAFEKSTGKLLWQSTLPALANATACTYLVNGKLYAALSVDATKEDPSGFIMALALA